jgi:uncharacterized protein (DUF305 family)
MITRAAVLVAVHAIIVDPSIAQTSSSPVPSGQQGATLDLSQLPEQCRKAAESSPMLQGMQGMMGSMMAQGQPMGMQQQMSGANRDYMQAMHKSAPAMMAGMSIDDPELAFICAMIPHHQSAVDMSQAALKSAKDVDVKKFAEKTINEQQKEIEELTEMAKRHKK